MGTQIEVKNPKLMAAILMLGAFIGLFGETALNMALTDIMESIFNYSSYSPVADNRVFINIGDFSADFSTFNEMVFHSSVNHWRTCHFNSGAVLAGLSPNFALLETGRVVQAIGTGIIMPVMVSVLLVIFPIHKRGAVMGIMGLVITLGPALGPTLSGVIIATIGWNYIFWISAVVYVVLTLAAVAKIENVGEITKPKIDVLSIVLSSVGFGGVIYGLASMAGAPFSAPIVWAPLLVGIIALILFGIRQNTMDKPMINLSVFKQPMFTLGTAMMFLSILVILSTGILLPMYLKGALLFSAAVAGLLLLPGNAVNVIMSPIVGTLFDKIGPKKLAIMGSIIVLIGNIIFVTTISATTPAWQIIVAFMVLFFGLTMVTIPAQTNGLNALPRELYADGSAAMNTLNQVAGAAGTAISITLFTAGQINFAAGTPDATQGEILAAGIKYAFYFITGISVLAVICSIFMKKPSAVQEKSPAAVKATEPVRN